MNKVIKVIGIVSTGLLLTTGCSFIGTKANTSSNSTSSVSATKLSNNGDVDYNDIFTERDLKQVVDTSDATTYKVSDNKDITITKEGVYVIKGSAKNVSIIINAEDSAKVQLVLDDLNITNDSSPCIYVKSADKVFVNLVGDNSLSVTGTFTSDGDTNTDAVIFSKEDIVINGTGSLDIESSDNGISSKDDLKITGGDITINCVSDGLEANDSVAIADGSITINSNKDGIHAEYDEDDTVGYVYIKDGTININASDDAIHATTYVRIDNGTINLNSREGIEGTYITINGGTININASDDGINGGQKSRFMTVGVEINGGDITIDMGQGDTDAIDSNGNLYINGGTLTINAQSPFDYDGEAKYTSGTMIINGEETTTITNQFAGGQGGPGGGRDYRR